MGGFRRCFVGRGSRSGEVTAAIDYDDTGFISRPLFLFCSMYVSTGGEVVRRLLDTLVLARLCSVTGLILCMIAGGLSTDGAAPMYS